MTDLGSPAPATGTTSAGLGVTSTTGPDPLSSAQRIRQAVASVLSGKDQVIEASLTVLLADGHLLIEDVPGVGKTLLAKALAAAIGGEVSRIQFTPDLLPSDVTGVSVYNPRSLEFQFRPGAVFANIVLADEINRASPKTQAALLECMAERQVTVDGVTHTLARPFLVIATQNPIEMEGTYTLPEAQRDRFMARISMGYPNHDAETAMLLGHAGADPVAELRPVVTGDELAALFAAVDAVYVSDTIRDTAVNISALTRTSPMLRLGASPRATLHLVRAARAAAMLADRDYVVPEDLLRLAPTILGHRVMLSPEALAAGNTGEQVVSALLARLPRVRR